MYMSVYWFACVLATVRSLEGTCHQPTVLSHSPDGNLQCMATDTVHIDDASTLACGMVCHLKASCPDYCMGFASNASSGTCSMCLICPQSTLVQSLEGDVWYDKDYLLETGEKPFWYTAVLDKQILNSC